VREFEVVGKDVTDKFCGMGTAFWTGAVLETSAEVESGKTRVRRARWSAFRGMGASSKLCQFQAVSGAARSLLLPSTREDHSAFLTLRVTSKRLSSSRPIYVELANKATTTMVWIGCDEVILERSCRSGVTFLFNHEGAAAWAAGCSPRKREGRKLDAMLAIVSRPAGFIERTTGSGEAWGGSGGSGGDLEGRVSHDEGEVRDWSCEQNRKTSERCAAVIMVSEAQRQTAATQQTLRRNETRGAGRQAVHVTAGGREEEDDEEQSHLPDTNWQLSRLLL
jgi:hypothetical protein